jgi:Lysozyme like domain
MAKMSGAKVALAARDAGFRDETLVTMVAIARAESGWDPRAHNATPPDDSYGLWQINMLGKLGPERRREFGIETNDALFDPATNARAARLIHKQQGLRAWSVFKHGTYEKFIDDARTAVEAAHLAAETGRTVTAEDDITAEEAKAALREVLAERRIRLDWDGSDHSFYEALSFIHFNAADGSFVGDIPATSTRKNRRGTPTSAKEISAAVAGLNRVVKEAGREIGLTPEQIEALAASVAAKMRP